MIAAQEECRCDDLTCHPGQYCSVTPLGSLCLSSARNYDTITQCGFETCYGDQICFGTYETQQACLNYKHAVSVDETEILFLPFGDAGHMSTEKYIKFKNGECSSMTESDCRTASRSGNNYRTVMTNQYTKDRKRIGYRHSDSAGNLINPGSDWTSHVYDLLTSL